jgi:ATP/maltotriose-dependent transcriptional regulator MalT
METPDASFVATKLCRPTAPERFVDRTRLVDRLDAGIDRSHGLLLVCAPAGSGKSTLLSGWIDARDEPTSWVQIEPSDSDPVRFWSYVAAALDPIVPGLVDETRPAIRSGLDAAVSTLVNRLAAHGQRVIIVLDDYHLVDNSDVHDSVERFIHLRPANVTVVVSTRVDPPFRLGRLRVRDQVTEIRAADLRFASDEAAGLLGSTTNRLGDDAIRDLCDRTEGWAAGLVLAGLSLQLTDDPTAFVEAFRGDDQLVVDYLSDELLAGLSADDRERLLETSILDRMSGPLVDAVCGTDDSAEWLRRTAATNQLLIGLDRTGTWFRYHHLLRDLLRFEAEREIPERVRSLHAAAGRWHEEHGDLHTAVGHFLDADEMVAAADIVAMGAKKLLNDGHSYTVLQYLDRLGDLCEEHEGAAIVKAWVTFVSGRFAESDKFLEIARRLDVDGIDTGLIDGLSMMSSLARGDTGGALVVAETTPTPTESTHTMVLGAVHLWAGRFDDARTLSATADEQAKAEPHDFAASVAPGFEAVAELEAANPVAARRRALDAVTYADDHGIARAPQMSLAHGVLARTADEPVDAVAAARRSVELARRAPELLMLGYTLASAGDVLVAHGDEQGHELLREARVVVDRCPDPGIVGRYLDRVESRHGRAAPAPSVAELVEDLTDREIGVLRYLPSELSQREIASELFVSLNTVKTHCKAIYRKLGVPGRKAAVQAARDLGLL